jgi:hypothetical protein
MPNRMLRDWTGSDKIDLLSANAEVLFIRLIMKADDFGSFHALPKLIKSYCFPLKADSIRDADISRWIEELLKSGLIAVYTVSNKPYLRINDFGQRLQNFRNKFPEPPKNNSPGLTVNHGESPPEYEEKRREYEEKLAEFSKKLFSDTLILEETLRLVKRSLDQAMIDAFETNLKLDEKVHETYREYRRHFRNWIALGKGIPPPEPKALKHAHEDW